MKLAVFLLVLVALDVGLGRVLEFFYFRQKSGLNYRTTYAVEECRDDIVVLGSSRAQSNYVPAVLAEELAGTVFNAGRDGQSILYASAVFDAMAARHAPRIVVLDVIPTDFYRNPGHYDRLSALLPYYRSRAEVRPVVNLRSRFERFKMLSSIYPYNSLPLQILKYNLVKKRADRGHVPQFGEIELPLPPAKEHAWLDSGPDAEKFARFGALVRDCHERGIRLYLVLSPVFEGEVVRREIKHELEPLLEGTPYEIWDLSDHPEFVRQAKYFRDRGHLNDVGAARFSGIVAEMIRTDPDAAGHASTPAGTGG